jgi:hypothetical protein
MELIREADVFQLFWSTNSMRSPFVRQEWEFAVELQHRSEKDAYFVRPTYWQEPLPADSASDLPPASLRQLHFQRLGAVRETPPPPSAPAEIPSGNRPGASAPMSGRPAASPPRARLEAPPLPPPRPAWSLVVPALLALLVGGAGLVWVVLRVLR